ncbi:TPM domain-containing protein [Verrucomicrobiaceae bacterium R5-34]|nr:TPM domain-containing protein [Verrucomicrobiaceae bacterium R5-34]
MKPSASRQPSQRLFVCLGALLMLFACVSVMAQGPAAAKELPSRPMDHILDDSRLLSVDEREALQRDLGRRFIEQQVDVYLVVVDRAPAMGAKAYARALGEKWSRAPMWCVVFYQRDSDAGVLAEAGGIEVPQPSIDLAIAQAVRRARRESGEKEILFTACRECPNELRFLLATHQRSAEKQIEKRGELTDAYLHKRKLMKLLAVAAGIGLILSLIVIVFIVRKIKSRRRNFRFPETVWRERFLGPHSGGSGIVVHYRQ